MIVIDFDGTIVDVWARFHKVFCNLTAAECDVETYVQLKHELMKDGLIAERLGIDLPATYFDQKKLLLEDEDYLRLDRLMIPLDQLKNILDRDDAIILSKRRNKASFYDQIIALGLGDYKDKIYIVDNMSKSDFVLEYYKDYDRLIVLGDSIVDLEMGRLNRCTCIINGSGLSSKKELDATGVDYLYFDDAPLAWKYFYKLVGDI